MDLDFWIHQNETSDPHPCKMSWIRYTILDLSLKGQSNEIFDLLSNLSNLTNSNILAKSKQKSKLF